MNFVFKLERVISTPAKDINAVAHCKVLANVVEFMWFLENSGHNISIWTERPNTLDYKLATEEWLQLNQIPYNRLVFDRPTNPIFVNETPPEAQYFKHEYNNAIIAELFEEWKKVVKNTDVL
tara:strand:+ start:57 stop:422 length:366 start_codon:yes stop_codon:yes gene_type:complete